MKMKTKTFLLLMIVALFSLSACGSTPNEDIQSQEISEEEEQTQGFNSDLNLLTLGTLKLEETDMAVSVEQSQSLLPYWKLLETLLNSGTAAQEEIDAVVLAINTEMTEAQLSFIGAIDLETTNIRDQMSELGIEFARGGSGTLTDGSVPEGGFGGGGGIPGQGGGPGSGGVLPDGVELSPEEQATREARIAERTEGSGLVTQLIQAVITYLESK